MQEGSARERQRVLATAFEEGIRHFDVARMYGLGAAEAELGIFGQKRRDRLVIATKFGIDPNTLSGRLAHLQAPARRMLARSSGLRRYIKRRSNVFDNPRRYDADTAQRSLETSLRELRTDYVDILLMHDPGLHDIIDLPAVCDYFEKAHQEGYIRAWGIAGEQQPCISLRRSLPAPAILQMRDDVFFRARGLADELSPAITFGVLAGALDPIRAHLDSSAAHRARWSEVLGADASSSDTITSLLIQDALHANAGGVVLFSTTRPRRLQGLASRVEVTPESTARVRAFRTQLMRELPQTDSPPGSSFDGD
jgi:D-threo-aldose 1-dehydrogenase